MLLRQWGLCGPGSRRCQASPPHTWHLHSLQHCTRVRPLTFANMYFLFATEPDDPQRQAPSPPQNPPLQTHSTADIPTRRACCWEREQAELCSQGSSKQGLHNISAESGLSPETFPDSIVVWHYHAIGALVWDPAVSPPKQFPAVEDGSGAWAGPM